MLLIDIIVLFAIIGGFLFPASLIRAISPSCKRKLIVISCLLFGVIVLAILTLLYMSLP